MVEQMKSSFMGARIIVTGHSGFKGSWLTKLLIESGAEVYGLSISPPIDRNHVFYALHIGDRVQNSSSQFADVRTDAFNNLYREVKPHFVFHLAAQAIVSTSYKDPYQTVSTNVLGTLNVLESLRLYDFGCTGILITSDKCYKNKNQEEAYVETDELGGDDPYSGSKAAAEILIQSYLTSYPHGFSRGIASARAGNVFGGGDWSENRLIPDCARSIFTSGEIEIRMPNATRPWTYVLDIVSGYMLLALSLRGNPKKYRGSWNFASGENLTVEQVVKMFIENLGKGKMIINESPLIGHESNLLQIDPRKANDNLGWSTKKSIANAMHDTVAWYSAQNQGEDMLIFSEQTLSEYL